MCSLEQCITTNGSETQKKIKNLGAQIWDKPAEIEPESRFFLPFCQVWFINFHLDCIEW